MSHTTNCGCTETQQTTYICGECAPSTPCNCPVIDLSTDCVLYDGDTIQCQSTDVVLKNTVLSIALKNIVDFFCLKLSEVANRFRIVNIGLGAKVYKQENLLGQKELRTIISSDTSVIITEGTTTIDITVPDYPLIPTTSNVGTGAGVFKELSANDNKFRRINASNSGTGATILKAQVENTNDISIIAKTLLLENQGAGTSLIKDLQSNADDNKIRLKSLISSDGSVNIDSGVDTIDFTITPPPTFGYLKSFYVNSAYVPTVDSPSDGSIIRPYVNFDEAKISFTGSGSIITPQYAGATIILQTNSYTSTNPTVNNLNIKFENNSSLVYTGTDLYMFDTEVLYPLIIKNVPRNDLTQEIYLTLSGKGTITRTLGIGLVRGMGSNRNGLGEINDKRSQIQIGLTKDDEIILVERTAYPPEIWDGDITDALGVSLESTYNTPHKYSLQLAPTTPLLYAQYESLAPFNWGVTTRGAVTFYTVANSAVKIVDLKLTGNKFNFLVFGQYISTVSAIKMVDFPTHYQPHPNRYMIELDNSQIYCDELQINDAGGYDTTGIDSFLHIKNNSFFEQGNMEIFCKYYINKFLNVSDVSNTAISFSLNNGFLGSNINVSKGRYFIDTPSPTYTLRMPKTTISTFLNKSVTSVAITPNTFGTLSSFFGNPVISGIINYVDDATATTAGLIANSLYFNTTNNAIDKT